MIEAGTQNRIAQAVGMENIRMNEPMRLHTSFKVGGPADMLVTPVNEYQIRDVLKICHSDGVPVFVMGNGTNLVVRDGGIRGVVIKILDNYNNISVEGNMITAEAGALLSVISKKAMECNLKGMEFASGIPGTAGGAAAMNAGAYDGEIKHVCDSVDVIDDKFNIVTLTNTQLQFGYRKSIVSTGGFIVTKVRFSLEKGNYDEIKAKFDDLMRRRKEKQPLHLPSAGSTFKRPVGGYAAKLIEEAGLKGRRVGDAMVSDMHCGFIVNMGGATASQILKLIEIVKQEVYRNSNIMLEPEVKIIGED